MRIVLLLSIMFVSCVPPCDFESKLGLCVLKDSGASWTQDEFTQWEKIFTEKASTLPIWIHKERLNGWNLQVVQKEFWEYNGGYVAGLSYCTLIHTSMINNADLYNNSISHELFHAMQGCISEQPIDANADFDHSDWYRAGLYPAIDQIRMEVFKAEGSPIL